MPLIEVKLYDRRVTEDSVPKMIEALTNALRHAPGARITVRLTYGPDGLIRCSIGARFCAGAAPGCRPRGR